ncbi:hypothetical protein AVO32_07340 [Yersinia pestis]|nr:hypothetical protein AVO32_07340 [Yersinia pestis]
MKRPIHLYYYRAMLRRLVISIMLGMVSALIVWLFHQAMLGLEWLLFSRTDVCEMTGEYTLLPGLLLSCVIATTIARWLRPISVYRSH